MLTVVLVAALPNVVFFAVAKIMSLVTGRQAALANSRPPNPKPLNMRLSYDAAAMDAFFKALGPSGLAAEQRFLRVDLLFPVIYGGTLATSLSWLSGRAGYWPAVPIGAVVIGGVADWIENLVQLALLRRYVQIGQAGLRPLFVRIASGATLVKLIGVGLGFVIVALLALGLLVGVL